LEEAQVVLPVMSTTEPSDLKRFGVVVMVSLAGDISADFARLPDDLSVADCCLQDPSAPNLDGIADSVSVTLAFSFTKFRGAPASPLSGLCETGCCPSWIFCIPLAIPLSLIAGVALSAHALERSCHELMIPDPEKAMTAMTATTTMIPSLSSLAGPRP